MCLQRSGRTPQATNCSSHPPVAQMCRSGPSQKRSLSQDTARETLRVRAGRGNQSPKTRAIAIGQCVGPKAMYLVPFPPRHRAETRRGWPNRTAPGRMAAFYPARVAKINWSGELRVASGMRCKEGAICRSAHSGRRCPLPALRGRPLPEGEVAARLVTSADASMRAAVSTASRTCAPTGRRREARRGSGDACPVNPGLTGWAVARAQRSGARARSRPWRLAIDCDYEHEHEQHTGRTRQSKIVAGLLHVVSIRRACRFARRVVWRARNKRHVEERAVLFPCSKPQPLVEPSGALIEPSLGHRALAEPVARNPKINP